MASSQDTLILSFYGRVLLKGLLVILVGVMGLLNTAFLVGKFAGPIRWILGRSVGWAPLTPRGIRVSILIETCVVGCILLAAIILGVSQTTQGAAYEAAPSDAKAFTDVSARAGDLIITISVKPDRPGQNYISLGVFDTRRPAPAAIDQVLVRVSPPASGGGDLTAVAEPAGESHFQINGGIFDTPGDWMITVTVKRKGFANTVLHIPWTVLPSPNPTQSRLAALSSQAVSPLINAMAVMALALWGTTLVGLRLRGWASG